MSILYPDIAWKLSSTLISYPDAMDFMESQVEGIIESRLPEMVWLLEHPPLYTSGTSAKAADLLDAQQLPVFQTGRGGQFTYHGPGQRIAYVMLDLKKRSSSGQPDIRLYVQQLERWLIAALAHFGVAGFTREGRVGVWVQDRKGSEAKIAAMGIRLRKWVSFHGIALNVAPDLTNYSGIVPCGISGYGVTSLAALGINAPMEAIDEALHEEFAAIFWLKQTND